MYSILKILFGFLLFSITIQAQEEGRKLRFGGGGTFNIGFQTMDIAPLSSIIESYGYDVLSDGNLTIGGGGQFYLNRWVVGMSGGYVGQGEVTNTTHQLSFGGGYGLLSLGYDVLGKKQFALYPSAGFGFSGSGLSIVPRYPGASFTDVLQEPEVYTEERVSIGAFTPMYQLALNGDWFVTGGEDAAYGFLLGLTAGYRIAPAANYSNVGGTELDTGPDFNTSGFFLTLRLGGGYRPRP